MTQATMTDVVASVATKPVAKLKGTINPTTGQPSGDKVAAFADRISSNWQDTLDGIIRVAADCAAAKNELSRSEKRDLLERLPFGESMFSKLAAIGDDRRLMKHQEPLPPSISTLYVLHKLSDEQFEAAVTEGTLKPDVTREDLQE